MKIRRFPAAMIPTATFALWVSLATSGVAQDPKFGPVPPPSNPLPVTEKVQLSSGAEDVLKLSKAKVNDDVIVAFIQNGNRNFYLTASEILYLRQQGVSDRALTAMLGQPAPAAPQPQAPTSNFASEASAPQYASPPSDANILQPAPASTVYVGTPSYYSFYDPWPYWSSWYAYPAFSFGFYWGWGWGGCGYWSYPSYCYPNYCHNGYYNNGYYPYCNNGYYYPPAGNPATTANRPQSPGSTPLVSEGRQPSGVSRTRPLVSEMRQPSGVNQSTPLVSEGRQPSGVSSANQTTSRTGSNRVENRSASPTTAANATSYWSGNGNQQAVSRPGGNQTGAASVGGQAVAPTRPSGSAVNSRSPAARPVESRSATQTQFASGNRSSSPFGASNGNVSQRATAPTYVNRSATSTARPSNFGGSSRTTWSQPAYSATRYGSSASGSYQRSYSPSYRGGGSSGSISRPSMSPSYSSMGGSSFSRGGGFSGGGGSRMSSGGGSRGGGGGGGRSR